MDYQKIEETDSKEIKAEKKFYNELLLDRYPYFFRYVYPQVNTQYKAYLDKMQYVWGTCHSEPLQDVLKKSEWSDAERTVVHNFYRYSPITDSDSSMNLLCKHIESIDWQIAQKTKAHTIPDSYELYKNQSLQYAEYYKPIVQRLRTILQDYDDYVRWQYGSRIVNAKRLDANSVPLELQEDADDVLDTDVLQLKVSGESFSDIVTDVGIIVNCLVDYYYKENPHSAKDFLWTFFGDIIYRNIIKNTHTYTYEFPMLAQDDESADVQYLGYDFVVREVTI